MVALIISGAFAIMVVFKPFALLGKVTDNDRILNTYEWFHTANTEFVSRVAQIKTQKQNLETETESKERNYLRTELSGQQQICRDLVAKYNAKSANITLGIYKGTSLPQSLNMKECE